MVRVEDGRRRLAVALGGAMACALIAASTAAAEPLVSPGDGQHWNTPPTYTVVPDGRGQVTWTFTGPGDIRAQGSARPEPAPSIVLPMPLMTDGAWRLTVEQSGEATARTFVIDRIAPPALTLAGPASVVSGQFATFTLGGGEPGARYVWRVDGPGGASVLPPTEVATPTATVPPLRPGSYALVVAQIDLAGNVGAEASAPLAVTPVFPPVAPAGVAPPLAPAGPALPLPRSPVAVTVKLPSSHSGRMTPRRAAVVRTVRPMLRWRGAPKGTTLYNVQIFRVDDRRAASSNAVALKKLRSVFPRTNRLRTPRLRRGVCYVWRVWPYRGEDFTKRPLGVSNFCVAKARRSAKR